MDLLKLLHDNDKEVYHRQRDIARHTTYMFMKKIKKEPKCFAYPHLLDPTAGGWLKTREITDEPGQ